MPLTTNTDNTTTIAPSLLGLDQELPQHVTLIRHKASGKHLCEWLQQPEGPVGVLSFSARGNAAGFIRRTRSHATANYELETMPFDEAREVAKSKPPQVVALYFADDSQNPCIHYVR